MAQKVVNEFQALGIPGTLSTDALKSVVSYELGSAGYIRRAFTYTSTEGVVSMGGAGAFAGILINPHNHAVYDNLDATLEIPSGSVGSFAKSGYILVYLSNDCVPGDKVYFTTADGKLGAGTASTGQTQIAGAKVTKGGSAGSLVEISLIPQVV